MKVFLAGLLDEMYLEDVSEQQAKDHPSTYFKTFKAAKEEMIMRFKEDVECKQNWLNYAKTLLNNIKKLKESDVRKKKTRKNES